MAQDLISDGLDVEIRICPLPRYQSDPRPVYALYTEKDKLPLKVQGCIDYLTGYFEQVAEQYQQHRKS